MALPENAVADAVIGMGSKLVRPLIKGITKMSQPMMATIEKNVIDTAPTMRDAILNVQKGTIDANKFIGSDVVKETTLHNARLADRLGITNNPNPYKQRPGLSSRFVENFDEYAGKTNFNGTTNMNTKNIGALYSPKDNMMMFKKSVTPSISFHENLHA